jgi:hypothetical protein
MSEPTNTSPLLEPIQSTPTRVLAATREAWDALKAHDCSFDDGLAMLAILWANILQKSGEEHAVLSRRWSYHLERFNGASVMMKEKI